MRLGQAHRVDLLGGSRWRDVLRRRELATFARAVRRPARPFRGVRSAAPRPLESHGGQLACVLGRLGRVPVRGGQREGGRLALGFARGHEGVLRLRLIAPIARAFFGLPGLVARAGPLAIAAVGEGPEAEVKLLGVVGPQVGLDHLGGEIELVVAVAVAVAPVEDDASEDVRVLKLLLHERDDLGRLAAVVGGGPPADGDALALGHPDRLQLDPLGGVAGDVGEDLGHRPGVGAQLAVHPEPVVGLVHGRETRVELGQPGLEDPQSKPAQKKWAQGDDQNAGDQGIPEDPWARQPCVEPRGERRRLDGKRILEPCERCEVVGARQERSHRHAVGRPPPGIGRDPVDADRGGLNQLHGHEQSVGRQVRDLGPGGGHQGVDEGAAVADAQRGLGDHPPDVRRPGAVLSGIFAGGSENGAAGVGDCQRHRSVAAADPNEGLRGPLPVEQGRQRRHVRGEGHLAIGGRLGDRRRLGPRQHEAAPGRLPGGGVQHGHPQAVRGRDVRQVGFGLKSDGHLELLAAGVGQRAGAADDRGRGQHADHPFHGVLGEPVIEREVPNGVGLAGGQDPGTAGSAVGLRTAVDAGDEPPPPAPGLMEDGHHGRIGLSSGGLAHGSRYSRMRTGRVERSTTAMISTSAPVDQDRPFEEMV